MSFVEKATLQLVDKSSANINKINRSLLGLEKTSKRLQKNLQNTFKINVKGADVATKQVNALTRSMTRLSAAKASPSISLRGVRAATNSLNKLRAQASKPIHQQLNIQRNGFGGSRSRYVGGGSLTVLDSFLPRLATTIENAVIAGFRKGLTQQDVADTKLELVNATPAAKKASRAEAFNLSKAYPSLTVGTTTGFMAENLALTKGDVAAAKQLSALQARLVELDIALGNSADAATENAFKFSRAGDAASVFTDAAGNFDAKAAAKFGEQLIQARAQFGQEITADLVARAIKAANQSKFSLASNSKGLLTLLSMEEESSGSAVGVNQMLKNLGGFTNNKTILRNLEEAGLITTREIKVGTSGGKTRTETVRDTSVNGELLNRDPRQFVENYIIPLMKAANKDPNNENDVKEFAAKFVQERTGLSALITLILKNADIRRSVEQAEGVDASPENINRILNDSSLLAVNEALAQLTSLAGQAANALEGPLIGALNLVRDVAGGLAAFVGGDGSGDGSGMRAGAVAAGGLAAGGLLYKGGKGLLGLLNPLSVPAAQLSASATQLQIAAAQLQGAAMTQSGLPVPGQQQGTKLNSTPFAFWKTLFKGATIASLVQLAGSTGDRNTYANMDEAGRAKAREEARKTTPQNKTMSWKEFFFGAGAEEGGFKKAMGIDIKADADAASQSFKDTFQTGADQIKTAGQEFGPAASIGIIAAAGPFGDIVAQRIAAATQNIEVTAKAPAAASTATPRAVNTGPIGAAGG